MNLKTIKRPTSVVALCLGALIGVAVPVQAAHIDQLFVNITPFSSDGLGNFVLRYDEYFGSDGRAWTGSDWGGNYGNPYETYIGISIASGPGTLSGSTDVFAAFQGLVNAAGTPTAGFGMAQFTTQFINDTSDAALFTDYLSFSIVGFDKASTYSINVTSDDCCVVSGPDPTFSGTLVFDPTVVINQTPEPSSLALLCLSLGGLAISRRKNG